MLPMKIRHRVSYIYIALICLAMVVVSSVIVFSFLPPIFAVELRDLPVHAPPRTVVSISSFSQRVFHLKGCLDSVFAQSQLPDRIIISIPKKFRSTEKTACWFFDNDCYHDVNQRHNESEEDIIAWFSDYVGAPYEDANKTSNVYEIGTLTVQFLEEDWGPATKLIGALLLEAHPETVVITLDDDVVYHRDTVKYLATHVQENTVLSFGCEMWNAANIEFIAFGGMADIVTYSSTPRVCRGWVLGWIGVAYHVSFFGIDILTVLKSLPRGCFYNDDIWLSGYLSRRGVQKVYVPNELVPQKHTRDATFSLSTIVDSHINYKHSCARYLFPT